MARNRKHKGPSKSAFGPAFGIAGGYLSELASETPWRAFDPKRTNSKVVSDAFLGDRARSDKLTIVG